MIELNYQTWFKVDRRHVVSWYTDTSWVDSGHTPHILVTLWWWRWWVYTCDVVSGESDAGIGGGEHCHHTGVGVSHSDCVVQLYPIRSPWRRPAEHQYTIWYQLWWQIPWLWRRTCMRQKDCTADRQIMCSDCRTGSEKLFLERSCYQPKLLQGCGYCLYCLHNYTFYVCT